MNSSPVVQQPAGTLERMMHASSPIGVWLRVVVAAVGMLLCASTVVLPSLVLGMDRWSSLDDDDEMTMSFLLVQLGGMTMPLVAGLIVLWILSRLEKVRWREYTGGMGATVSGSALVVASLAAVAVTCAGGWIADLTGLDADRPAAMGAHGDPIVLVLLIGFFRAFMMQGIQEELWFRGFAFRGVAERPWLVLTVTTSVFTALHLVSQGGQESVLEQFLYLALPFGMGLWAGVERWCTGSVWAAVGVHGGIHMGLTLVALAGWPLGPAGWIAVGLALTAVAGLRLLVSCPWRATPVAG